ncbi:MAG TPA: FecR family protein [Leptospiraceae bacterium]|nr:FecR family protein [Leptospiraceae bacterium]
MIRPGVVLKIPAYLSKKPKIEPIAGLKVFLGEVQYKQNELDWKNVEKNQKFLENDVVRTKEKSSAEIEYLEQPLTVIQVREKSIIKLEKASERSLDLRLGNIFLKVLNQNETDKIKYRVKTPSSVASVRGTEFYVSVDKQETTLLGCYKGLVDVNAQNITVKVPAGYGTKVVKGQPPLEPFKLLDEIIPKPVKE